MKCYKARVARGTTGFTRREVMLRDGYESKMTTVIKPQRLCNPVSMGGLTAQNPSAQWVCYKIKDARTSPSQERFSPRTVFSLNVFGQGELTALRALRLCVPVE